jgi:uncharacterized protein YutE (UPF0331/DUF86 family)
MVDEARLERLLARIGTEVEHLQRLADLEPEDLLADRDRMSAAKYGFVVSIEAAIDVCRHIIGSEGLRAADDFADSFAALGEAGWLPVESVPDLQDMARFRNLLVHGYADVDDKRVGEILRTRLGDLRSFRRAIASRATSG